MLVGNRNNNDAGNANSNIGLPIGNLTSQYFANYYLAFFDHYAKEKLKIKYYIRYMDDILIFSNSKAELKKYLSFSKKYLEEILQLNVSIKASNSTKNGVVFLNYLVKPWGIYTTNKKMQSLRNKAKLYKQNLTNQIYTQEDYAEHMQSILQQSEFTKSKI